MKTISKQPGLSSFLLFLLGFLLFAGCSLESSKTDNTGKEQIAKKDTFRITDDSITLLKENKKSLSYLESLLLFPFDLVKFKIENGLSNSSPFGASGLFMPDTIGFYYRYMRFRGHRRIRNMPEGERFAKFQIYVYKYGNNTQDFYDTNEYLVGMRCAFADTSLGKFNLVDKSLSEIDKQFGKDYMDLDSIRIYQYENRVLSLFHDKSKVVRFKYYHLADSLAKDSIPARLTDFYFQY